MKLKYSSASLLYIKSWLKIVKKSLEAISASLKN